MCSKCGANIDKPRVTAWEEIGPDTIRRYCYDDCKACGFSHSTTIIYEGAQAVAFVKARGESINVPSRITGWRAIPGGAIQPSTVTEPMVQRRQPVRGDYPIPDKRLPVGRKVNG